MIYNPKATNLKELEENRNLGIKSKKKFGGDFKQLLKSFVSDLEISVINSIVKDYGVEYTSFGDQIIKIKIKDKNLMIEKLITCTLFYNKNDLRYGYITPLFTSEEKAQKTKKYELPRFSIIDNNVIINSIINKLEYIIEEF